MFRSGRKNAAVFAVLLILGSATAWGATSGTDAIGTGDVLYVDVYRAPEMSQNYQVRPDGTITLPYVGTVDIGGQNESAAANTISRSLAAILKNPRVTVNRADVGMLSVGSSRTSEMQLEILPLQNSNAETLSTVLQGMSSAGGSVSHDPDTNSLLITDTPAAIKNMINAISRLDRMQSQITQVRIESKIAEVQVSALKEMGIRWFVQSDKFTGGWNPPAARSSGINTLRGNFSPLGNEILGIGDNNNFSGNALGREFVGGDTFDRRLSIPVVAPLPGQAFLGFASGSFDLGTLIDALVSDEKAELLANPTILTVNHKRAVIKMVDEFPFTEFGTEISGARSFSVKFLELGIVLDVTPHVYQDEVGTYVKLELNPQISFPAGISNGVPVRSVRSSNTVANVRDGQTLIVGGILTEDHQNIETKLPGIGDLPIIGKLFRHKEKTKFRKELMIFVTPTVHARPEEITWDRMIDVAEELRKSEYLDIPDIRKEALRD